MDCTILVVKPVQDCLLHRKINIILNQSILCITHSLEFIAINHVDML